MTGKSTRSELDGGLLGELFGTVRGAIIVRVLLLDTLSEIHSFVEDPSVG